MCYIERDDFREEDLAGYRRLSPSNVGVFLGCFVGVVVVCLFVLFFGCFVLFCFVLFCFVLFCFVLLSLFSLLSFFFFSSFY